MKINLYPYNYYILYAAIALLVVFLILLVVKAMPLLKSLQNLQGSLDTLNNSTAAMQAKLELLQPKDEKKKVKLSPAQLFNLLLLYNAVRKDYKKAEGSGIKQVGSSASNVLYSRGKQSMIQNELLRIIKKGS